MTPNTSRIDRQIPMAFLIALCVIVGLCGLVGRDLWTPDEPRVAAISLEMGRSGDFVVPHLAGEPFVEQPPLYYAVAAGAARLLGGFIGNAGAMRLTSLLWGLGALMTTYLLGLRLLGKDRALVAVVLLGTMAGFIENTHWIRVDSALLFFVTASVWCFGEVFLGGRRWFCLPAGAFAAGAFLTKGAVGPAFVAVAWLGLVVVWRIHITGKAGAVSAVRPLLVPHVICAAIFILLAGVWVLRFKTAAGPQLWKEWFWTNHIGRLMGTAPQLGHVKTNHFYYLKTVAVCTLPWLPLIMAWIMRVALGVRTRRAIEPSDLFLLLWGAGMVTLLSLSATKRDLYLLPVLPAFALMYASVLDGGIPRWLKPFFVAWLAICAVIMAVMTSAPLLLHLPGIALPWKAAAFLGSWSPGHALAAACLVTSVFLMLRRPAFGIDRLVAVTACAYVAVLSVGGGAVDAEKGMRREITSFVSQIESSRRERVAGWGLSETARGCLYFYGDWPVPQIRDEQRLRDIISRNDKQFDSVLIEAGTAELPAVAYRVLTKASTGGTGHKRELIWLEGEER